MSFGDHRFWNAELAKGATKVTKKNEQTSSRFNEIVEGTKEYALQLGLTKWEEYKCNNKKSNKITPVEGDTINYAGTLYRLLTGFYFHHKKLSHLSDKYDTSLNVCVIDLQTKKYKIIEWKLPIFTGNMSRSSSPRLDITLDKYLGLENVFDKVTGKIGNRNSYDYIKSGLRLGEHFSGMKLIYRDLNTSNDKGIVQETWEIPTNNDLPKNGIIFFDTVLLDGLRGGYILNEEKRAEYDRLNDFDGYPQPEESELSIWYDSEYD